MFIVNYSWYTCSHRSCRNWLLRFGWSQRTTCLGLCRGLFHYHHWLWWGCHWRNHFHSSNTCDSFGQRTLLELLLEQACAEALALSLLLGRKSLLWCWMGSLVVHSLSRGMIILAGLLIGNGLGSGPFSCLVFGIEECLVGNHSSQSVASWYRPWPVSSSERMGASSELLYLVNCISLECLHRRWRALGLHQPDS